MDEFNLLNEYPKLDKPRYVSDDKRTINHRIISSLRDKDFFDGDRNYGYGGFKYDGRWKTIAEKVIDRYKLNDNSKILQINCEMGFFLHDIKKILPNLEVYGVETSSYAYQNFYDKKIKSNVSLIDNYCKLNFKDQYFDFILCIGAVYTLNLPDIIKILKEIVRIGKNQSFINLASYETHEDYWLMKDWSLLGTTILKKEDWKKILKHVNYKGDFSFTNANSLNIKRNK